MVKKKIGSSHTKETYIKKFGNIQSLKVRFKVLPFYDWLLTRYYNWLGMIPNQIANDRKCRKVVPQKTQIMILIYFLLIISLYPYPIIYFDWNFTQYYFLTLSQNWSQQIIMDWVTKVCHFSLCLLTLFLFNLFFWRYILISHIFVFIPDKQFMRLANEFHWPYWVEGVWERERIKVDPSPKYHYIHKKISF